MPTYRITCDPVYVFKFSFLVEAESEEEAYEKLPDWSICEPVGEALRALGAQDFACDHVDGDDVRAEELQDASV